MSIKINQKNKNINITKQVINENKILIKITGPDKKSVLGEFWKFVNHGNAVKMRSHYFDKFDKGIDIEDDTGFNWLNDYLYNEGYFRTDFNSLMLTLQSICLFQILREKDPDCNWETVPQKIEDLSRTLAMERFNQMEDEDILNCVEKELRLTNC